MVRLFWMRVKKKKIFRPSSFVALMILFIRVCVWHILAEKYKGAQRERERKWRWWWGLCCWCVSKNFSSRISHIACPRFSWRRADDAKKKWNRIELLTIVFLFSSFDYSSSYIFEGSSIAKIPNVFFFLSFESPLKRSLSRFWLHIAAEKTTTRNGRTKFQFFEYSCGLFPRVEERNFFM